MKLFATADALLRGSGAVAPAFRPTQLIALLVVFGFTYGVVLGGHALTPLQMLYSGLKVPILLTASSLVCLPNLFVAYNLLGLREDFAVVVRGIVETQAVMALVLASLAPVTALAYVSYGDYEFAKAWNGLVFLVASIASQRHLTRVFVPLVAKRPQHRHGKAIWLVLYMFVTIQLAWMLRPFVGSPELRTTFLREGVWDNAYVVVVRTVIQALGG